MLSSSWLLVQREVPWVPATQASPPLPSHPIPSHPTPSSHFTDEHGEMCGWQSSRQAGYGGGGSWGEMFIGSFLVEIEGLPSHLQRNGSTSRTLEWPMPTCDGTPSFQLWTARRMYRAGESRTGRTVLGRSLVSMKGYQRG